jgi:hypothetical protein
VNNFQKISSLDLNLSSPMSGRSKGLDRLWKLW